MVAFTDLTTGQQGEILTFMGTFREVIETLIQSLDAMVRMDQVWQEAIAASVTSLDSGVIIPDSPPGGSGSGSVQLSREQVLAFMTQIETVLTNFNATVNRQNFILVVGIPGL